MCRETECGWNCGLCLVHEEICLSAYLQKQIGRHADCFCYDPTTSRVSADMTRPAGKVHRNVGILVPEGWLKRSSGGVEVPGLNMLKCSLCENKMGGMQIDLAAPLPSTRNQEHMCVAGDGGPGAYVPVSAED